MNFKDLNFDESYDSETNDLLNDFYIPALSCSTEYYRAVGFFNSKSLSFAATGIKNFILNNGKMKIICGAQLSENDVKSIISAEKTPEEVLTKNFLEDIDSLETNIKNNYIDVLSWMIANDLLDIKVAIKLDENHNPCFGEEGILHTKVGVFKDIDGNYMTINGSNNETAFGWGKNYENFDVFKGWVSSDRKRLQRHIDLFLNLWNEDVKSYDIMDIPEAVERHLISRASPNIHGVPFIEDTINNGGNQSPQKTNKKTKPELYDYQIEARKKWFKNGKKGIFAMATGTGKTYTALGCVEKLLKEEKKLVTIISVPQMHLIQQWKKSVMSYGLFDCFDEVIIVDSTNPNGKSQFRDAVYDIDKGKISNALILTTHKSLSSEKFYHFITEDKYGFDCSFLLVGDEMHGLGSVTRMKGLIPQYNYRLGLSATPERHFDEFGTAFLFNYFGKQVYCFSLEKALEEINPKTNLTYLTPYRYNPYFLELTLDELKNFKKYSAQILYEMNKDEPNFKKIERLMFQRANTLKEAENKYEVLRDILNDMDDKSNLLVYCNENQKEKVVDILGNEFDLNVTTFTNEDGTKPSDKFGGISEREYKLRNFAKGNYDSLVALHCLDEGVDVPSASRAILMCNSTNPREFIQRVGRVIRRYDEKNEAEIYDMIIKPSSFKNEFYDIEKNIFEKEKIRANYIGDLALNNAEYHTKIFQW